MASIRASSGIWPERSRRRGAVVASAMAIRPGPNAWLRSLEVAQSMAEAYSQGGLDDRAPPSSVPGVYGLVRGCEAGAGAGITEVV
jgi:hypothetical protein